MGYGLFCGLSVAQKNKLSTMLSSDVQSIDLPMDCMAWWFWTMIQPNGCSTPALKSSVVKQWIKNSLKRRRISIEGNPQMQLSTWLYQHQYYKCMYVHVDKQSSRCCMANICWLFWQTTYLFSTSFAWTKSNCDVTNAVWPKNMW